MNALEDTAPSVLLVDDDERFRTTLARAFQRRGWDVCQASNAVDALRLAQAESPEHAVVDLVLKSSDGLSLVRELIALDPSTRIVLLTGFASVATAIEAIRSGAVHYLAKPADLGDIIAAFEAGGQPTVPPMVVPSLDRVEWEHIQRVMHSCAGNVTQAAKLLGIHRRSLQRKLRRNPPQR
jgi:two-component system response regulator RegA